MGSQLAGFAVNAGSFLRDGHKEGVAPTYKGSTADWKQVTERQSSALSVSAQNARPTFVTKEGHTCSKIYASAVSSAFHAFEAKSTKSLYADVTLASFMSGPDQKVMPTINAYPNPSRGVTRLSLSQVGNDNYHYKIKISNTIGKVVAVKELSTLDVDVDMSSLPAGVYFYSLLVNDKMVETKRLILQK
ncbi:T9SS type A sorting domain-containing protein [Pontibacter qinzhouensis]|uniref:T9SS type A sorting domain-containing protein n=2 Tax=Pontibacter qinzhouensis TaxID=2603253 RepID=A0A5C8KC95_9BACT|nr:T9SS type A sorting domain-containing protein [Pontibacter qinzhouensis]